MRSPGGQPPVKKVIEAAPAWEATVDSKDFQF